MLLLLLAVASGFLLACFYVPTHDQAYVSVRELAFARPYALWARGMHRIAAHLAILFALPHFAFLLWKDRSRDARRLAWATGLLAFALFALWPFTRLVHVFSAPVGYLTRPYIVYRSRDDQLGSHSPRRGWERSER